MVNSLGLPRVTAVLHAAIPGLADYPWLSLDEKRWTQNTPHDSLTGLKEQCSFSFEWVDEAGKEQYEDGTTGAVSLFVRPSFISFSHLPSPFSTYQDWCCTRNLRQVHTGNFIIISPRLNLLAEVSACIAPTDFCIHSALVFIFTERRAPHGALDVLSLNNCHGHRRVQNTSVLGLNACCTSIQDHN
jgi:hypothetical protein